MADLSAFATKDKEDEGVILPVKIEGKKIPLALKIYGSNSDVVREYENKKLRKIGFGLGKTELSEDALEELLENKNESIVIRIGGIYTYDWKKEEVVENEPVILFGRTLKDDKASKEFLVEKMPSIVAWIKKNSDDNSNFLG